MDKETIFRVLFKCKVDGEQKFTDFSQLTPAEESKQIRSFFERNGNTVTEMKWDAPTFD